MELKKVMHRLKLHSLWLKGMIHACTTRKNQIWFTISPIFFYELYSIDKKNLCKLWQI